ncbi:unnamed protein product [Moneuplotes crassus]|uniref:Endonuclease/exonuclease/phosphatase domain-containing protein n=1 Tax=Euplotes crassus TaxID=5936 RepID=A0AAD1X8P4_EUPCR|nr:unnamed protein product [Moneuplotes crassus]
MSSDSPYLRNFGETKAEDSPEVDLTLLSYNVLHPINNTYIVPEKLIKYLADYEKRYSYHFESLFPDLAPDVLCLQEVSEAYISMLKNSTFYKKGGYTRTKATPSAKYGRSPMILSKYPMECLNSQDEKFVIVRITKETQQFIVICVHLSGHEQNIFERAQEMWFIDRKLKELNIKSPKDTIFLLGDLNLHYPGESKICDQYGFHDLWLERHSHFDGYSWDPQENIMSGWMHPLDNRRMRLDRICLKPSNAFDLIDIQMVAKERIGGFCLQSSDHFGLLATFKQTSKGFTGDQPNAHKQEYAKLAPDSHGFRSIKNIVAYRVITAVTILLMLLYLIYKVGCFMF